MIDAPQFGSNEYIPPGNPARSYGRANALANLVLDSVAVRRIDMSIADFESVLHGSLNPPGLDRHVPGSEG